MKVNSTYILRIAGVAAILLLGYAAAPITQAQNPGTATICHIPPGNPDNPQTLTVGIAAVAAHLDHGDLLEACGNGNGPNNGTLTICHFPPGNPENAQTLTLATAAAEAHLAHGDDIEGPCPEEGNGPPPEDERRAVVCHIPPGNPENAQTLEVGIAAVPAHLEHGDLLGTCEDGGGGDRITICHKEDGQPDITLEIEPSALDAHIAHGDSLGSCEEGPGPGGPDGPTTPPGGAIPGGPGTGGPSGSVQGSGPCNLIPRP